MYGAEAASPNLLLDDVLIDAVDGAAIVFTAAIVRACVERLLDALGLGGDSAVVTDGALVCRRGPGAGMP